MSRQISGGRQFAFYLGTVLQVLGVLLFLSIFVSAASVAVSVFGDGGFSPPGSMFPRAIGGMVLMAVGRMIREIAKKGLAGSGLMLDPEQARQDLEPYSRMAGGMLNDALEETELNLGRQPEKLVVVKCRSCGTHNQEQAKFCQECGQKI